MDERLQPSRSEVLRVLIVAGDSLARAGLTALLADQPGVRIVGEAAPDADSAFDVESYRPDVVLWDAGLGSGPQEDDLAGIAEADAPVLVLLPPDADAAGAHAAGARGLLRRETDSPGLVAALRAIDQGLIVWDPAFSGGFSPARGASSGELVEALTRREEEVLQLLAAGLPNKTIAERLAISEHTVKFHVNAVMGKLGAHSRTEAVARAARLGLVVL